MTSGLLQYHILSTLWVGQNSIIYRATNARNELVVLKMLLPNIKSTTSLEREARLSRKMNHGNIVKFLDYIYDAPMPAIVMEYFTSYNLKSRIVRGDRVLHDHAHLIITQVCEALAYVHKEGYIHRDMKPENVLIADDGTTKIIDFALALEIHPTFFQRLARRRIAGTRPYIAPETITREKPTEQTDIYSLGITIYEMLVTRPPFVSEDRDELLRKHLNEQPAYMRNYRREISQEMDELVLHMLAKRPEHRPPNMDYVLNRLKDIPVFDK